MKNQLTMAFSKNTDLTDRRSMHAVFGSSSGAPRVDDDVDDGDAIDFFIW